VMGRAHQRGNRHHRLYLPVRGPESRGAPRHRRSPGGGDDPRAVILGMDLPFSGGIKVESELFVELLKGVDQAVQRRCLARAKANASLVCPVLCR
jgi:hypothetical protein